ncbi:MAG: hypothetical protein AAB768_01295 [Patescibacteria group bacterium]
MDFDIDTQIKLARPYLWLAFPVLTVIIIIVSLSLIVGNSDSLMNRISQANQKIQTNIKLKAALETKLTVLKSADEQALNEKLKSLAESLPLEKEIWVAITKLRMAGSLTSFHNSGNQTISVEYNVADSLALEKLLQKIDELKPLMSVNDISYGAKKARLEIEIANLPK